MDQEYKIVANGKEFNKPLAHDKANSYVISSTIIGVLSVLFCIVGWYQLVFCIISCILAIVTIVLSIIGLQKPGKTNILGIILGLISMIFFIMILWFRWL